MSFVADLPRPGPSPVPASLSRSLNRRIKKGNFFFGRELKSCKKELKSPVKRSSPTDIDSIGPYATHSDTHVEVLEEEKDEEVIRRRKRRLTSKGNSSLPF